VADLDDFDIDGDDRALDRDPAPDEAPPPVAPPRPPWVLVLAAAAVIVSIGAAAYLLWPKPGTAPPTPSPPPAASAVATPVPSEPPIDLPSLEESDPLVRDLARGLSSHAQLGAWLAQRGLVRVLTVSAQNVAEGRSPAPFVRFLTPQTSYGAVTRGSRLVPDPKSHAGYDDVADGIGSIDAAEAARVYRVLRPLFGAAYAELGYAPGDFDRALERALGVIASTPLPEGEVELRKGRVFLEYADPRLEALPLAQKQVLRMGPRNAAIVKAKAAEVAAALGR
jgi:hypothetical protein